MLQNQLLTRETADAVEAELAAQKDEVCILEFLGRNGLAEEEQLAAALAQRLRLSYLNLATQTLDPDTTLLIREELATKHRMIAVRQEGQALVVATANPLDRDGVRALEFSTGHRLRLVVATGSAIGDALGRAYHFDTTLNAYLQGVPGEGEVPIEALEDESADLESLKRQTSLPPVVKLLNLILLDGIKSGSSDIHIEAN